MNICFTEVIEGYPGYLITRNGIVFSVDRKTDSGKGYLKNIKGLILKPRKNRYGYIEVVLYCNGIRKVITVHRLVAKTFIPNPDNKKTINHKNGIKQDNRVENLEWNTHSENITHAYRCLKRTKNNPSKGKFGVNSKSHKSVMQLKNGHLIKKWTYMGETKTAGFSPCHISSCCTGKRKLHKGFEWKYVD